MVMKTLGGVVIKDKILLIERPVQDKYVRYEAKVRHRLVEMSTQDEKNMILLSLIQAHQFLDIGGVLQPHNLLAQLTIQRMRLRLLRRLHVGYEAATLALQDRVQGAVSHPRTLVDQTRRHVLHDTRVRDPRSRLTRLQHDVRMRVREQWDEDVGIHAFGTRAADQLDELLSGAIVHGHTALIFCLCLYGNPSLSYKNLHDYSTNRSRVIVNH